MTVNSWSKNFAFYLFHQTDFITVSFLFCFLYYQGFFSHTDTDNSQDSRGREGIIFYSTLPLPPAHKHWDNFTWSIFEYLSRIIIIQVTKHRSSNERVFFKKVPQQFWETLNFHTDILDMQLPEKLPQQCSNFYCQTGLTVFKYYAYTSISAEEKVFCITGIKRCSRTQLSNFGIF